MWVPASLKFDLEHCFICSEMKITVRCSSQREASRVFSLCPHCSFLDLQHLAL